MPGKVRFFGQEVNGELVDMTDKVDESVSKVMYLEQKVDDLEAEATDLQKDNEDLTELLSVSDGELRAAQQKVDKLEAELASTWECLEAERKDTISQMSFFEGLVGIRDRLHRLIQETRLQPTEKRISNKRLYRLLMTTLDPASCA